MSKQLTAFSLLLLFPFVMMAPATASSIPLKSLPAGSFALQDRYQFDLSIMGSPLASEQQCVAYLRQKNPLPETAVSAKELVRIFYEEARHEGIRPDVAFAQSLHETGFFRYGGDVLPPQNNYAGLGTTGNGVKGAWFKSPRQGIRAQIQHLKGYATPVAPQGILVDPRYDLLKKTPFFGKQKTWQALNGKWAVPGRNYGQTILRIHQEILKMPRN
ncbi:MAG: glucosaminidase domain-containing protein [Sporomusaceae bacterium]|nr:glucosaminidase domain-containing protein [Sporomusaceae bacterium]